MLTLLFFFRAVAGGGGVLYLIRGNHHPFSLEDLTISYPLKPNTISITTVGVIAFLAPALIIALLSLFLIPASSISKGIRKSAIWRRKLWEWNTGWLGLGLSLAGTLFVTSALKDIVGKPRPNLLARCDPDTSKIVANTVSGVGKVLSGSPVLVDIGICQNNDQRTLLDGFASFPSGHSSFSWAGLFYLTLWLCAKFAIAIPSIQRSRDPVQSQPASERHRYEVPVRNKSAAPPLYLLALCLSPTGAAIYVCATRWSDNQHHGFDIISGALIGALFAWFGFRWYHLPIRGGGGWSWGPRAWDRAFYVSPGTSGYASSIDHGGVVSDGRDSNARTDSYLDMELGPFQEHRATGQT